MDYCSDSESDSGCSDIASQLCSAIAPASARSDPSAHSLGSAPSSDLCQRMSRKDTADTQKAKVQAKAEAQRIAPMPPKLPLMGTPLPPGSMGPPVPLVDPFPKGPPRIKDAPPGYIRIAASYVKAGASSAITEIPVRSLPRWPTHQLHQRMCIL